MSILNKNVPFPKTYIGRLGLSLLIVMSVLFISGVISANGNCTEFGSGSTFTCTSLESGWVFLTGLLMMSGYFLLLPILVPVFVLSAIIEMMYRVSNKRKATTAR